jgi:hypothetical protein
MIGLIVFVILLVSLIIPIRLWAKHYQKKEEEEAKRFKNEKERLEQEARIQYVRANIDKIRIGTKICIDCTYFHNHSIVETYFTITSISKEKIIGINSGDNKYYSMSTEGFIKKYRNELYSILKKTGH